MFNLNLKVVECAILNILKEFSEDELVWAIDNNYDLTEGIKENRESFEDLISFVKSSIPEDANTTEIKIEQVLDWIKENNLPFYNIILSKSKGKKWLEKQIKSMKENLLSF